MAAAGEGSEQDEEDREDEDDSDWEYDSGRDDWVPTSSTWARDFDEE